MADLTALVQHLTRTTALDGRVARRVIDEVVAFFDDEIESLRYFSAESQLSGDVIEDVSVLPAREVPLDADSIKDFRERYRERFEGQPYPRAHPRGEPRRSADQLRVKPRNH